MALDSPAMDNTLEETLVRVREQKATAVRLVDELDKVMGTRYVLDRPSTLAWIGRMRKALGTGED